MPTRFLKETGARHTEISSTICVVGAGIAGLIAATRLARDKSRRVVVIESGLNQPDAAVSALNEVENRLDNYPGAFTNRSRGLGGTSALWAGKMLPLSAQDVLCRPYLNLGKWPIELGELDAYRQEIEALMGVDREPYDGDVTEGIDATGRLPSHDVDFCLRWPKRPTASNHNLGYIFRRQIVSYPNLEIWMGATVSSFQFSPETRRLTSITAADQAGRTLRVTAEKFLLTAGTLETTRLLLLADRDAGGVVSQSCDALGRYFNDHLGLDVATLRPLDRALTNRMLSDRSPFGSLRHLHFELRGEVQKQCRIGSAYFDISAELPESSALTVARRMARGLKRGRLALNARDLAALLWDAPSMLRTAQWQALRRQKYWPPNATLSLKIWVEQLPHWENRIALSSQRDSLGVPRLRLEWGKTDAEERIFRTMVEKIRRFWKASFAGVCDLEWAPIVTNPALRWVDSSTDLAHPAGSTRMGTDPRTSVVDPHLRVHRIPNLSAASASVFPSSGSANPTLTIMCLAMRAADALAASS